MIFIKIVKLRVSRLSTTSKLKWQSTVFIFVAEILGPEINEQEPLDEDDEAQLELQLALERWLKVYLIFIVQQVVSQLLVSQAIENTHLLAISFEGF